MPVSGSHSAVQSGPFRRLNTNWQISTAWPSSHARIATMPPGRYPPMPRKLPVAAATARISATKAFHECAKENIQVHGGMGFTWEFDCHLYYRRSKLIGLAIGSALEWKQRLMTRLEQTRRVVASSRAA